MLARNSAGPAPAAAECKARTNDQLGGKVGLVATPSRKPSQVVRAELVGSDRCLAAGYVTRGTTPVLAMCRKLVTAGIDPATPLECYRGTTLALTVASIGHGADLRLNGHGSGFRAVYGGVTAPPVAPLATDAPRPHTVDKKHLARRAAPAVRCTQSRRRRRQNGSNQIRR